MEKIIIEIKYLNQSSSFDLKVNSFKRLFKGSKEIDLTQTLQWSIHEDKKLALRPFERMVVGTGVIAMMPQDLKIDISSKQSMAIQKGLSVIPTTIDSGYKGEIDVIIYNGSQFLIWVAQELIVARGTVSPCIRAELIEKYQPKE
jgi:dUTPase